MSIISISITLTHYIKVFINIKAIKILKIDVKMLKIYKIILSIFLIIFSICCIWIYVQYNMNDRYIPETYRDPKNIKKYKLTTTYIKNIKNEENAEKNKISIVTYNIQKFPLSFKTFEKLYQLLKNHSIILLQECFDETLEKLEEYFPDYHICRGTLKGLNIMNSGLVILSKFPILNTAFYPFKKCNPVTFDILSEKGFLTALIDIDDEPIYVINTHLQSCDFYRYDNYAVLQLNELNQYLNKVLDKKYIVGGDFNIDINDFNKIIKENKQNLYHPDQPSIYINFTTSHTWNCERKGYEPLIFDYFISTIQLDKPNVIPSDYSDHNPVETKFKM